MGERVAARTYYFDARRVPRSAAPVGTSIRLHANAENLAEVLSAFQPNRTLYGEYIELVRRVMPTVKYVSVYPAQNNTVEIRLWPVEESTKRDDLTVPLANCGTGVGQLLALLYVVSRTRASVIIIDEPNSFLHPGAARALIAILREYREHQFIISTHFPEVFSASEPQKIILLKYIDEQTVLNEIDSDDINGARYVLDEIGAKLSDVLGADVGTWGEQQPICQYSTILECGSPKVYACFGKGTGLVEEVSSLRVIRQGAICSCVKQTLLRRAELIVRRKGAIRLRFGFLRILPKSALVATLAP
jgi:hypothetical protein